MANIFGDDNFDDIYGGAGKRIGAILARQDKSRSKDIDRALLYNFILAGFGAKKSAMQEERDSTIDELKTNSSLILEGVKGTYNNERNTQLRKDLAQLSGPDRDTFINNKITSRYQNSDLQRQLNNLSLEELNQKMSRNPDLRNVYNDWFNNEKTKVLSYYDEAKNNPYVTETLSTLQQPYLNKLIAQVNEIENDPTKTSLFYAAINKMFPGFGADKQIKLATEVKKYDDMITAQEAKRTSANKKLLDAVTMAVSQPKTKTSGGEFIIEPTYLISKEDLNKIDSFRKHSLDQLETTTLYKNNKYNIPTMGTNFNINTNNKITKEIFSNIKDIQVLEMDESGKLIVNENANPLNAISSAVGDLMVHENALARGEERLANIENLHERAIQQLVEDGHFVSFDSWKPFDETIYFIKPAALGYEVPLTDNTKDSVSNSVKTNIEANKQKQDRKQPRNNMNDVLDNYLSNEMENIKTRLDATTNEDERSDLNVELDRLTSVVKNTNPKLRNKELIKLIISPPDNLKGMVIVNDNNQKLPKLGEATNQEIIKMIGGFKSQFGQDEELNNILETLERKPSRDFSQLTEEDIDELRSEQFSKVGSEVGSWYEKKQMEADLAKLKRLVNNPKAIITGKASLFKKYGLPMNAESEDIINKVASLENTLVPNLLAQG